MLRHYERGRRSICGRIACGTVNLFGLVMSRPSEYRAKKALCGLLEVAGKWHCSKVCKGGVTGTSAWT
jgi:hypothetical protein